MKCYADTSKPSKFPDKAHYLFVSCQKSPCNLCQNHMRVHVFCAMLMIVLVPKFKFFIKKYYLVYKNQNQCLYNSVPMSMLHKKTCYLFA